MRKFVDICEIRELTAGATVLSKDGKYGCKAFEPRTSALRPPPPVLRPLPGSLERRKARVLVPSALCTVAGGPGPLGCALEVPGTSTRDAKENRPPVHGSCGSNPWSLAPPTASCAHTILP